MRARFLPQELIEAIIDHLHYDKHTLQNCSLVCKAWLLPARYHLFYYLKVTDDGWNWEEFSHSRSVALPSVRALSFGTPSLLRRYHTNQFQADPSFLGLFDNLKSVFLAILMVRSPFTARSMQVTEYTRITRLRVGMCLAREFAHIANFICAFSSLETLVIGQLRCQLQHKPSQVPPFPRSVHSLGINVKAIDVLEWLSLNELPALHTIYFSFHDLETMNEQLINSCLRTLGPTLRAIGMEMNHNSIDIVSAKPPAFDLSCNTELRFIYFHLTGSPYLDNYACGMVVGTLSQIVSQQVEVIEFTLGDVYGQHDTMDWGKVDEMLLAPQFSVLRKVAFGWEDFPSRYDAVWFKTRLPRCHARKILSFPDKMPSELFRSCTPSMRDKTLY